MNIDGAHEEEFNDWYDTEHVPRFRAVDGVLAARRFRASTSQPSYAAFYHLRDLDVVTGAQWREAATTPWSARVLTFRHDNLRIDRKDVVSGKSVSVRVDLGGRGIIK